MALKAQRVAVGCLLALAPGAYLLLAFTFAVNIPCWDDYDTVLAFLNGNGIERLHRLCAGHNEHRLAFTRLTAWALAAVAGHIDFRSLIAVGVAGQILLFALVCRLAVGKRLPTVFLAPIPFILFSGFMWENMAWATTSLQHHYVLVFAVLACHFIVRESVASLAGGLALGILAALTSATGLLLFPVAVVWFGLRTLEARPVGKGALARLLLSGGMGVALWTVYLRGLHGPAGQPGMFSAWAAPLPCLRSFLALLGAWTGSAPAAPVAGGLLGAALAWLALKRYDRVNPPAACLMLFLLANVLAATVGRVGRGLEQPLASRYVIVAALLLCLTYVGTLECAPALAPPQRWRALVAALAVAVGLNLASWFQGVPHLAGQCRLLIAGMDLWRQTGTGLYYPVQKKADAILRQALAAGHYRLPMDLLSSAGETRR